MAEQREQLAALVASARARLGVATTEDASAVGIAAAMASAARQTGQRVEVVGEVAPGPAGGSEAAAAGGDVPS